MNQFELYSFNNFIGSESIFEASTLAKVGIPKEMISAIHQKEEHKTDKYKALSYVHMGGRPVTLPYKYFRPSHDIEVPAPITFTGRKVPPPAGSARTAQYTDFAQYLQDVPNGPLSILITRPEDDIFLYLYYKQKWGGGPGEGGQQYAILVWDKDKKEAVDFGFVGLTTEGVEKSLVRTVHRTKGGNTNAKVQEYVNTLADGAPRVNKPVYSYEFEVTQAPREARLDREAKANVGSSELIRVFADRYKNLVDDMKSQWKEKMLGGIDSYSALSGVTVPQEVVDFAENLGANPSETYSYLLFQMKDFRAKIFEAGKGAYRQTTGLELENENKESNRHLYGISYGEDPKDTRVSRYSQQARRLDAEKVKQRIPLAGDYAAIPSLIKAHKLDGTLHKFMFYLLTGRIDSPAINVLALLGIDPNSDDLTGLPDFESWVL